MERLYRRKQHETNQDTLEMRPGLMPLLFLELLPGVGSLQGSEAVRLAVPAASAVQQSRR